MLCILYLKGCSCVPSRLAGICIIFIGRGKVKATGMVLQVSWLSHWGYRWVKGNGERGKSVKKEKSRRLQNGVIDA